MYLQKYLPIVEGEFPSIIYGLIELPINTLLLGTETDLLITSTPVEVRRPVRVFQSQILSYVALPFTREEIRTRQHRGFSNFVQVYDVLPSAEWTSGNGIANVLRVKDGMLLDGISRYGGFATGRICSALIPPRIIQDFADLRNAQAIDASWSEQVEERTYNWQKFVGGDKWETVESKINDGHVSLPETGVYRCVVTAKWINGAGTIEDALPSRSDKFDVIYDN